MTTAFRDEEMTAMRRAAIHQDYQSVAQQAHPQAFELCICGVPRWRHPSTEEDRKTIAYVTTRDEVPHHLFIAPVLDSTEPTEAAGEVALQDPVIQDMADALRCTTHIANRGLRAAYLVTDMRLRGYVILRREATGRFAKVER